MEVLEFAEFLSTSLNALEGDRVLKVRDLRVILAVFAERMEKRDQSMSDFTQF